MDESKKRKEPTIYSRIDTIRGELETLSHNIPPYGLSACHVGPAVEVIEKELQSIERGDIRADALADLIAASKFKTIVNKPRPSAKAAAEKAAGRIQFISEFLQGLEIPENPTFADLSELYIVADAVRLGALWLLDAVNNVEEIIFSTLWETINVERTPLE